MRQFIYTLCLLSSLTAYSQSLTITHLAADDTDPAAREHQRQDMVGTPCALLKVHFNEPGAVFEGNVVPPVDYKDGTYWVYTTKGSYMLNIKHPSYLPLSINLRDYGIKRMESLTTYVLHVDKPAEATLLDVSFLPIEAGVWVDGKRIGNSPGQFTGILPGLHQVKIAYDGYQERSCQVNVLAGQPTYLSGELEALTKEQKDAHEQQLAGSFWETIRTSSGYSIYTAYKDKKFGEATAKLMLLAAERGSVDAQFETGKRYALGSGVAEDYFEAEKWLRRAAASDHTEAMKWMGLLHFYKGPVQNFAEAKEWFDKAALRGDDISILHIGHLYYYGYGVEKDYAEAVKWYRKAAEEHNNAEAKAYLAHMYYMGYGVTQSDKEAERLYRASADQQCSSGQIGLGYLYFVGRGVKQNFKTARNYFEMAAEQGDYTAISNIGAMYARGKGYKRDYTEAMNWYRKAADAGSPQGMNGIAELYAFGEGVAQDYSEALRWCRKVIESEGVPTILGWLYLNGYGVEKDYAEAMKWIQQSINQDDEFGMFCMGYAMENGLGVEQNREEAVKWYKKAAEQEEIHAIQRLKELK